MRSSKGNVLRKGNRFSVQKIWDSIRMSDRLGGRCREDRRGKAAVRIVVKRGQGNRKCEIEMGTLYKGGTNHDIR